MLNTICKIASDLIKFPSTASRPRPRRACIDYIENFFKDAGVPYTIWEPGDVRSLVARLGESDPVVCLSGHYDVVEAPAGNFRPRREGDRLYGRGSADMKTSLAAMMVLMRELGKRPDPPPVALMVTGDEESGGERGTAHILKLGFKCRFGLSAESTGLALANQAKGILGLELMAKGTSAHSARPWEGDNAIFSFFRQFPAIWEIFGEPEPRAWQTTMVPSVLSAGDSPSRVPDRCVCRLDIRYVPADIPEELAQRIEKAAPELSVRVAEQSASFYTDPTDPFLVSLNRTAAEIMRRAPGLVRKHATSDARHFSAAGIPAAIFGPGGENMHGLGEWVDLRQVNLFYRVLERFVREAPAIKADSSERPSAPERGAADSVSI
jgi:succinyl-diaminopimelate desuccinylase